MKRSANEQRSNISTQPNIYDIATCENSYILDINLGIE